ncbi:MAG TPA: 3-deoxy-8-phosphooctulonate synthase, partial [Candidatus Omnitrophota bacterium]|nr:3-deoxy-8-phosphooctulonate synthase [Candidatus Omnitrophota bacterium]
MRKLRIGGRAVDTADGMLLIAGPCVIESEKHCLTMARRLADIARRAGTPFIFKASYDKANRMSLDSFRGPGLRKGLDILYTVKQKTGVPVLSDVHSTAEVPYAAQVLDVIQIPALLCRQTDLVVAAAKVGKAVNIKKGQFIAPWD